jgi:hypothetical protein
MAGWGLLGALYPSKLSKSADIPLRKDRKDISNLILEKLEGRLGRDVTRLHQFATDVSGMESSYGRNVNNPTTSAKGHYQFTDDSFVTAKNRMRNILGYVPQSIANASDINDLSLPDQKAVFFSHLSEDEGSDLRIMDYLDGSTGADLYLYHHYKGTPDKATRQRMKKYFQ